MSTIDEPVRAPKRCCPASPPHPWHDGKWPNQPEVRFISAIESEILRTGAGSSRRCSWRRRYCARPTANSSTP